jgi:hypothetical protein
VTGAPAHHAEEVTMRPDEYNHGDCECSACQAANGKGWTKR